MIERFTYWIKFFILYRNWYEILYSRIKNINIQRVIFNNGLIIKSSTKSPLSVIVDEIFLLERYIYKDKVDIQKNDIVVDIGAHVGVFSLFALKKGAFKVYAYEPTLSNIKYIKENCNKYKNIEIRNYALSDSNKPRNLHLNISDGGNTIFETKSKNIKKVNSITLTSIFKDEKLNKINFLKIDCEGAEGLIFMTTPVNVLKNIDKISMEYHDNVSPMKHNEIKNKLEKAGFKIKLNQQDKVFGHIYAWK